MKRFILLLTICFSLLSAKSFANNIEVTEAALTAFKTSFSNATDVNWSSFNEYYKVNFTFQDQFVTAYYDREGSMIALKRNISVKQLPFSLQVSLKKDFNGYWISDMLEINNNEDGISYYATLENGDATLVVKSTSMSEWRTFKKTSK